jgi:hypothetical protein
MPVKKNIKETKKTKPKPKPKQSKKSKKQSGGTEIIETKDINKMYNIRKHMY